MSRRERLQKIYDALKRLQKKHPVLKAESRFRPSDHINFIFGCLFFALKCFGFIGWDWLWVTAPIWVPWVYKFMYATFLTCLLYTLTLYAEKLGIDLDDENIVQ